MSLYFCGTLNFLNSKPVHIIMKVYFNSTFSLSHSVSSAYQKWPTPICCEEVLLRLWSKHSPGITVDPELLLKSRSLGVSGFVLFKFFHLYLKLHKYAYTTFNVGSCRWLLVKQSSVFLGNGTFSIKVSHHRLRRLLKK